MAEHAALIEASKKRTAELRAKLAELKRKKDPAEPKAVQAGPKGGRYYVAPSGEKVYIK